MKRQSQQYSVQLDPEFVEKIDKLGSKLKLTRSQMMRNLMESGYEDAIILDKIGVFATFTFGQKLIRSIREGISKGKIRFNENGDLEIKRDEKDFIDKQK